MNESGAAVSLLILILCGVSKRAEFSGKTYVLKAGQASN